MNSLYVAVGGALGSLLRFWFGSALAMLVGQNYWVTMIVNVSGSYVIGALAGAGKDQGFTRHFILIGLLGGYTTFSTFSLQTLALFQRQEIAAAFINISLSVILSLLAVWLGWQSARAFE